MPRDHNNCLRHRERAGLGRAKIRQNQPLATCQISSSKPRSVRSRVLFKPMAGLALSSACHLDGRSAGGNRERRTSGPKSVPPQNSARRRPRCPIHSQFCRFSSRRGCVGSAISAASPSSPRPQIPQSEKCLSLNIWVPQTTEVPANGFPVLVWIFGGALAMGEASLPLYHGTNLVSKSVELNKPAILVTVNYRLNVFSFLASKEFQEWSEDGSTGNLGYCDMQLALQWVKSNIASFGGNPDNVTAFGESAGAQAVDILSAVFGEERLFRKAILQSGTAFQKPARTVAEQQPLFDLLYKNAEGPQELEGKARIEFLLGKTMEELLQAYKKCGPALTFAATLDGVLIKEQPATMPRCERGQG